MKNVRNMMRSALAMVLAISMLLGMVGCGITPRSMGEENGQGITDDTSRKEQEQIVGVLGGEDYTKDEIAQMTDKELEKLANKLLAQLDKQQEFTPNGDFYDENGAMKLPFDQAYPELVEDGSVKYDEETLLVKLRNSQNGKITDGMKAAGVAALELLFALEESSWYEAKLVDGTEAEKAIEALRKLSEVMLVEYNFQVQTAELDAYTPANESFGLANNEEYADQWYMNHCGIAAGYDVMTVPGGSSSVIVAVIDTGVDYDHEDLANNIWINTAEIPDNGIDDDDNGYVDDYYGVNIVAGRGNGDDDNGHGTHVAGIIAAENNSIGTVGIAYNVKIMPIKAAMASGYLNQGDIAKAILYAFEMGAEVINMSFGGTACSIAVQDALSLAYSRCVLVASAGNDGAPNEGRFAIPNYPAALTYVLGVMSVDRNGKESAFSNYDAIGFNGVEYELYAPGEQIMSLLPDNKYGALSGTSMAAPVVAAMAAILRSEFADRDLYPTKFIYGQLASTSEIGADCLNVEKHGVHNLPKVVDLHAALTKLPHPDVNLQDFAIFDTEDLLDFNNGDGVIDAGEYISLGLTLRNRWGMSKDTIVTIDALSFAGVPDPYVTIVNPQADFGSIGTYSTKNSGGVYSGDLLVGWEDPFYLQIAENCPNNYTFRINVTITCTNGLNPDDTAVHTTKATIELKVRNGCVLPQIIDEDMVLTADQFYIIANSTVIEKGVTVRVEPGTHIQFWTNDPEDPYADNYIAYLKVEGNLLVEGTKENPVYMYPSDLMYQYAVDIGATGDGYVSLVYADITQYSYNMTRGRISYADHCTFRQNYHCAYYRSVSEGRVYWNTSDFYMDFDEVTNSVFYKNYGSLSASVCNTCIFAHCGMNFTGSYANNVFLGNRTVNGMYEETSSMTIPAKLLPGASDYSILYWEETGTTYLKVELEYENVSKKAMEAYIAEVFGGTYLKIDTREELKWLQEHSAYGNMAIQKDPLTGEYLWFDDTPVADFLLPIQEVEYGHSKLVRLNNGILEHASTGSDLFEIPGPILPKTITFGEYAVAMDMEATYQLTPLSYPAQLSLGEFLYESTDESVVTVSDTGMLTPVGPGTAEVYVYYLDRAVWNYVTVTVTDYVALERLAFPEEAIRLAVGKTVSTGCQFRPRNTTRRNVEYTSSDEAVVTVDAGGNVTAHSAGIATITATCEGISTSMVVSTYVQTDTLQLSTPAMNLSLQTGAATLPTVTAMEGAELDLSWTSSDKKVAVIENGMVKPMTEGTTTLVATDRNSGMTATCLVIVSADKPETIKDMHTAQYSGEKYALTESGKLYCWDANGIILVTDQAELFAAYGQWALVLCKDGKLRVYLAQIYGNYHYADLEKEMEVLPGETIVDLEYVPRDAGDLYFVRTDKGRVYAWGGANEYGALGIGTNAAVAEPKWVQIENVVDMILTDSVSYFLTADGELYFAGGYYQKVATPQLIATGVEKIFHDTNYAGSTGHYNNSDFLVVQTRDGRVATAHTVNGGGLEYWRVDLTGVEQIAFRGHYSAIALRNGRVYTFTSGDVELRPFAGLNNVKKVYADEEVCYFQLEDGTLLGYSEDGSAEYFPNVSRYEANTIVPVLLEGITDENVTLVGSNVYKLNLLKQNQLMLQLPQNVTSARAVLMLGIDQMKAVTISDGSNTLHIHHEPLTAGKYYEVIFPVGAVVYENGETNQEEIRIGFVYTGDGQQADTGLVHSVVSQGNDLLLNFNKNIASALAWLYVDAEKVETVAISNGSSILRILNGAPAADKTYELVIPTGALLTGDHTTNSKPIHICYTDGMEQAEPADNLLKSVESCNNGLLLQFGSAVVNMKANLYHEGRRQEAYFIADNHGSVRVLCEALKASQTYELVIPAGQLKLADGSTNTHQIHVSLSGMEMIQDTVGGFVQSVQIRGDEVHITMNQGVVDAQVKLYRDGDLVETFAISDGSNTLRIYYPNLSTLDMGGNFQLVIAAGDLLFADDTVTTEDTYIRFYYNTNRPGATAEVVESVQRQGSELLVHMTKPVIDAKAELYVNDNRVESYTIANGGNTLRILCDSFVKGKTYELIILEGDITYADGTTNEERLDITFTNLTQITGANGNIIESVERQGSELLVRFYQNITEAAPQLEFIGDTAEYTSQLLDANTLQITCEAFVAGHPFRLLFPAGSLMQNDEVVNEDAVSLRFLCGDYQQDADADTELTIPEVSENQGSQVPTTEELNTDSGNFVQIDALSDPELILTFNKGIASAYAELYVEGEQIVVNFSCDGTNTVKFFRRTGFVNGTTYTLVIPAGGLVSVTGSVNAADIRITFTYMELDRQIGEVVVHESQLDSSIQRILTSERVVEKIDEYQDEHQLNPDFEGNAILNHITTNTNVTEWLRLLAESYGGTGGNKIPLGGNYWGTTNEIAIGLQLIDYMDFGNYGRFMYAPFLQEAPENTFPFVTKVTILNEDGEEVHTVGNEQITVRISFNRDMDTSIDLAVKFGSSEPYADYTIAGEYVDARTWEGTYTLNTFVENGLQYWSISNGCSAEGDLQLQLDEARFGFEIDTSAAQALIMQGNATDSGIELTWQQDDFDTLMGYNVYRSTSEDGYYQRLNNAVIPADQMFFFDDTVEPGVMYYYNFTVVKTDLTESEPSGKISLMSKDTMAPDIYHSPAANAVEGNNLVISATITDNLNITYANVYFRIAGESEWHVVSMSAVNDRYTAIIPAQYVTSAGVEYYIEAFDGVGFTYKGGSEDPFFIFVRLPLDTDSLGDVDGDGEITIEDALLLLYAINDKYNMTAEEFARADLNDDGELSTAEALMILCYVSGEIESLQCP